MPGFSKYISWPCQPPKYTYETKHLVKVPVMDMGILNAIKVLFSDVYDLFQR
jgi:hypothetical protein